MASTQSWGAARLLGLFLSLLLSAPGGASLAASPPDPPQAHRTTLKLAVDDNYPPYIFRNSAGQLEGYLVDMWQLWQAKTGVQVDINATDWARAQEVMRSGGADVIDTLFRTPEREVLYDFTPPYAEIPVAIFSQADIDGIVDLATLHGFLVGAKEGDACIDTLAAADITTIQTFPSYEQLVRGALDGKVRVFCLDEPPAYFLLYRAGADRAFRKAFTLYSGQFHRAVKKGDRDTLALVQEGFARITPQEEEALREKWLGGEIGWPAYLRYVIPALAVALLLGLLLAVWSIVLRRQVKARTAALASEHARMNALAENSADWIWTIDANGRHTYVNDRCQDFLGYTREAFLALDPIRLVHPDDQALFAETFRRAVAEQRGWSGVVIRWQHRDGSYRVLESNASPMFDQRHRLVGFQGADRDITDKRRMEEEMQASEERLRLALKAGNQGLYDLDVQTGEAQVNAEYAQMLGYAPADFHETNAGWLERLHPDDRESVAARYRAHIAGELPEYRAEFRQRTRTGEWKWILSLGRVVEWDAEGRPLRMLGTHTDIDARRRAEAELAAQKEVLEQVATGVALPSILEKLVTLVEAQAAGMHVAILQMEPDGAHLRHCVAPTLPPAYLSGIDPIPVQPTAGSCGAAAHRKEQVVVEDIASDPLWAGFSQRALEHGLRACWSTPIMDSPGHVLGTFAVYYHMPARPTEWHQQLIRMATHLAAIAIGRARIETALRDSETRFRLVSAVMSDIAYSYRRKDDQGYQLDWLSGATLPILGYTTEEIRAMRDWQGLVLPDDVPLVEAHIVNLRPGERAHCRLRLRHRSGYPVWLESLAECLADPMHPGELSIYGGMVDISERKMAEEELRLASQVIDSTAEGILVTDARVRIQSVNAAFMQVTGYTREEVIGRNPRLLSSGRHDRAFYRAMWDSLLRQGHWRGEIWNRRKDGRIYPELLTISAVRDEHGETTHYVGIFSDITALHESRDALRHLAHHDTLTGLPNRTLFRDRLEHALERARRDQGNLALLFIDLDRFKNVNDTLGHGIGDQLLGAVAERMGEQVRGSDTLARLGGDEFVVLLEENANRQHAAIVAEKLLGLFATPLKLGGREIYITASVGISLFPQHGDDADALLRQADLAMYQAKDKGRNTLQFYDSDMSAGALQRMTLEHALRGAAGRGELLLYYQPQVRLSDRSLVGLEALVRWRHPELGLVSPAQFIPLAEEIGLIGEIGDWVLQEACRQLAAWRDQGYRVPRLAVNLSVQQLERKQLLSQVGDLLAEWDLPASQLELEVTESLIMRQTGHALELLDGLRRLGVYLAIDDFGTGYSSLAQLKRLPLHRLKIDHAFVRDIGTDRNGEAIARAIIALGRSLNLEVLAEGVEGPAQADFLLREGCPYAQGFLFGHPQPAADLAAGWLADDGTLPQT